MSDTVTMVTGAASPSAADLDANATVSFQLTVPLAGTMGGYKSEHPGGVLVALADGSVHWISDSIDYETYQYLGDRDDGRTISGDLF